MDLPQAENLCQFTPIMSLFLLPGLSSVGGALDNSLGDAKIEAWTYGLCRYHRMEVLGALASVLSTLTVTSVLLYEALRRVLDPSPEPINGKGKPPAARRQHPFPAMFLAWETQ